MSIGEELAQARSHAGLTVGQVSQVTRIRQTIIRGIESDDYSACGGDFYARGHIRSIAKVVGADPEPLIHKYDAAHRAPTVMFATGLDELVTMSATAPRRRHGGTAGRRRPDVKWRRNWKPSWVVALAGLVLVLAAGLVGYHLIAGAGPAVGRAAGAAHLVRNRPAGHGRASRAPAARPTTPAHRAATTRAAPAAVPVRALAPVRATAFGVSGRGRGDHPRAARRAVDRRPGTAWRTDWYTTPRFGNLYRGTGLLLDMGHPVTVTTARIRLGRIRGASLQLRVGGRPVLTQLRRVAHTADAGGVVYLRLARPAHGRYVLIWFTRLPRNRGGSFQVSVYNVRLNGRP